MRLFRFRPMLALCALAAAVVMIAADADARSSGGGSRGSRTFSQPAPTQTAPSPARPMERTMAQPGQPGVGPTAARPATPAPAPSGGLFSRPGFFGGLAAGLLGAGLFGMLMGNGFMGGLAGIASFIGLFLQIGIVVLVGWLLWRWWQGRSQPAPAYASSGPSLHDLQSGPNPRQGLGPLGGLGAIGGGGNGTSAPSQGGDEIGVKPADFDEFERLLGEVQTAYGAEDLGKLRARVTPEMLSYFSEDLAANASRGVTNKITDVKLLQGDLSEAWREGDTEYATVAMRYSLNDQMIDRSGRVVEGGPDEAVEYWTFRRGHGGSWILSAIQQV